MSQSCTLVWSRRNVCGARELGAINMTRLKKYFRQAWIFMEIVWSPTNCGSVSSFSPKIASIECVVMHCAAVPWRFRDQRSWHRDIDANYGHSIASKAGCPRRSRHPYSGEISGWRASRSRAGAIRNCWISLSRFVQKFIPATNLSFPFCEGPHSQRHFFCARSDHEEFLKKSSASHRYVRGRANAIFWIAGIGWSRLASE